jgi:hypothetical protein
VQVWKAWSLAWYSWEEPLRGGAQWAVLAGVSMDRTVGPQPLPLSLIFFSLPGHEVRYFCSTKCSSYDMSPTRGLNTVCCLITHWNFRPKLTFFLYKLIAMDVCVTVIVSWLTQSFNSHCRAGRKQTPPEQVSQPQCFDTWGWVPIACGRTSLAVHGGISSSFPGLHFLGARRHTTLWQPKVSPAKHHQGPELQVNNFLSGTIKGIVRLLTGVAEVIPQEFYPRASFHPASPHQVLWHPEFSMKHQEKDRA